MADMQESPLPDGKISMGGRSSESPIKLARSKQKAGDKSKKDKPKKQKTDKPKRQRKKTKKVVSKAKLKKTAEKIGTELRGSVHAGRSDFDNEMEISGGSVHSRRTEKSYHSISRSSRKRTKKSARDRSVQPTSPKSTGRSGRKIEEFHQSRSMERRSRR